MSPEEISAIPGVDAAAMSSRPPFGNQRWGSDFTVRGWALDRYGVGVRHAEITPGLFRTMGVPLLRGRDFELADDVDAPPVVIINEALAETYFPREDPVGKRITFSRLPDEEAWRTIVGVVGNVRREALSVKEKPCSYAPVVQETTPQIHVLVRSARDAPSLVAGM